MIFQKGALWGVATKNFPGRTSIPYLFCSLSYSTQVMTLATPLTINQKHTSVFFLKFYRLICKSFILTENSNIRFLYCFRKFIHKRLDLIFLKTSVIKLFDLMTVNEGSSSESDDSDTPPNGGYRFLIFNYWKIC